MLLELCRLLKQPALKMFSSCTSEPAVLPGRFFRLPGFFPEAFEEIFFSLVFHAALHDMLPGSWLTAMAASSEVSLFQMPASSFTIRRDPSTISQEISLP